MEKQELIKKIDLQTFAYPDEPPEGFEPTIAYKKGFNSCAEVVINLIEQLDEPTHDKCYEKMADYEKQISDLERQIEEMEDRKPQKVKVKQFVAEWYEEHKHNLSNSLWKFTVELNEKTLVLVTGAIYTEFESWFIDHPRAYEVITNMKNGYEVEEEPKYYVNIGDLYLKEPLGDTSDFTISMTWNREYAYPFDSWNMAREHASELGGTVERVEV